MNDVLKQRKERPIKYLLLENISLAAILIVYISWTMYDLYIGRDILNGSGKSDLGVICAPFALIYLVRRSILLILDLCMSKTEVKRVFIMRVYNHRVYFFLIIKSFLTRKNYDKYCTTIETIGNQKFFLDESVLDDVSQTVHDWSELSESKFDFEIEYLKYSHIVVHIKQIRKIIRYV